MASKDMLWLLSLFLFLFSQSCIDGASRMFPAEPKKQKKKPRKSAAESGEGENGDDASSSPPPEPVDVLVDTVIGFLEQATAYMRAVANQVFSLLSASVQESTIDLILAVCHRVGPVCTDRRDN